MQTITFGRIITAWSKRALIWAFGTVLFLSLTARFPIAAQQLPQDASEQTTPAAAETPEQLQQLVAPIALYPDALVAQILAASTYPTQVVQADRWLQQHSNFQAEQLAATVNQQSWDPSVKALTVFPSVLANLDKNLTWTEALGDAYFNQQQDVLDAVQVMRQRAEAAGNLQNTPQERIITEGPAIVIEPAYPDVCYVPIYDPWIVYGAALAVYPGYFYDPWYGPPFISFGPAIGLGFFGGFNWGWPAWGFNWGRRVVVFNRNTYVSRSRYFSNHGPFIGGRGVSQPRQDLRPTGGGRNFNNRTGVIRSPGVGNSSANRGPSGPRSNTGPRPDAFNSARPGGINRGPVSNGAPGARPGATARPGFGGGSRPNIGGGARGGGARGGGGRGGGSRGGGGRRH